MEVDVALFSRLVGGGWGNGDTFTFSNKSSGAVVSTGSFSRSPSTVMLKVSSNVFVRFFCSTYYSISLDIVGSYFLLAYRMLFG